MIQKIQQSPVFFFVLALVIAIPALFINLGKQPVIDDEAIRALVAFEMLEKGEFITPTIAGELYLKKPPLYNWVLAASFGALDRADEIALRLPMVISLLAFTLAIFYYFRREMDTRFAALSALLFLTSGRIIIYESLHGLIDITYSMVIFIFFMHIYHSFMQGKLLKLYLIGYLLIAIGYLLKGLPSLVFLGVTLLVLFISNKKFKLLFHWGHYLGALLFILVVGGYYALYFSRNDISPEEMFNVIIGESTRRTAVRFGFWKTILHLLSYPFEVLYHFLPWGILVILMFRKGVYKKIRQQSFIHYLAVVFLANIVIYWISPEVFPRYILMLIPLLFGVFVYLYLGQRKEGTIQAKIAEWIFGGLVTLSIASGILPFFMDLSVDIPHLYVISGGLVLILGIVAISYWRSSLNRFFYVVIALLVLRIGFDLIVIPVRMAESEERESREEIRELVSLTEGHELRFYWNPEIEPSEYYGYRVTSYRFNYYVFLFRDEAFHVIENMDNSSDRMFISLLGFIRPEEVEVLRILQPPGHPSELVLFRIPPDKKN